MLFRSIVFKREAIADRGIWVAKKRYAVNVYDNEGVVYKEPKLKIMGIEIVRSSTPQAIKPMLKEAIAVAISGTESDFHSFIAKMKIEYDKLTVDDIAFPRGVNGLDKYSGVNIYASGCPLHVRGALLYNHHVKLKQLDTKYELIREGEKIKYLYLKMPNPIKENVIAYSGTLPSELNLHSYADYDIMWEKSFLDPLKNTIAGLKWTTEPKASLMSLFT